LSLFTLQAPLQEERRICFRTSFKISNDMDGNDPLDREGGEQTCAGDAADPIDWEGIKHAYVHGDMSLERIAEARGSSATTISKRAKREGWVRLIGTKRLRSGPKPRLPGAPRPKPKTPAQRRRSEMVRRLFEVLDTKLKLLEERMAEAQAEGAAPQSAADTERDARSLNALARLYAKLVELDEAAKAPASKGGEGSDKDAATRSDDADQLRRHLALRLERLDRERNA
jgi:hypothetical protein